MTLFGLKRKKKAATENRPVRKKKLFKNGYKPLAYILLLIVIILGSVTAGLYLSKNTIINKLAIDGVKMADPVQIEQIVNIPIGIKADSLDVMQIISRAESVPFVRSASVHITPTGTLRLNLKERTPIALLVNGDAMALVDSDGMKMPIPKKNKPDLPLLYGFSVLPMEDAINNEAFEFAVAFIHAMKADRIRDITISEIGWHAENGIIALTRENGIQLTFGKGDFERKLANWQEFYRTIAAEKGMAAFRSLDFRFEGQIVATTS